MVLGEALQKAYAKVGTKLGVQDADIVFRKKTVVESSVMGVPDTSTTIVDKTVRMGITIGRVGIRGVSPGAKVQTDDLKLTIPGGLIAEADLIDAQIIYKGDHYTLISTQPLEIYDGLVVRWQVIAREKK